VKRPRWLDLGGQEMSELRDLPAIQMLVEWLEWERAAARDLVLAAAVTDGDVRLRAGTALAFDAILRSLNTPVAIADMTDEEFVDPARRPSRKGPDAEV